MRSDLFDEMYRLESTYWWHVAKRRLILRMLDSYLNSLQDPRFLDIGCGTGMMMKDFSRFGEVFGVDGSTKAISYCKKRGFSNVAATDLTKPLPFQNELFDAVTMLDVLEHLDNDRLILSEIQRVLKPGGRFVLTVPAYPWLWTYWDEVLGHKRRYRRRALVAKLKETGFEVEMSSYFYWYLVPVAIIVRVAKSIFGKSMKQRSDFIEVPKSINWLLVQITTVEASVLQHIRMPFGLSIVCLSRKLNDRTNLGSH